MSTTKVIDGMRDVTVVDAAKITTGAVPAAALTNVDLVEGTKGTDIASAGTIVIGTDGGYFDITGTTGVTVMTVAAGRVFTLQFDGVVTLTHSSTLYLSGAANFTTEANDHMTFISVAANDVRQIGTGLKDGGSSVAPAGGANVYKGYFTRDTAAATATVAYTGVGFTVKAVIFLSVVGGTDQVSIGVDDGTLRGCLYDNNSSGTTFSESTTYSLWPREGSARQEGSISALGSDGFSIDWIKVNSPTGTAQIHYLAIG